MSTSKQVSLGFVDVRRVRVSVWYGAPPSKGDQLRSTRARYIIVSVELRDDGKPKAFGIARVRAGDVAGGRVYPWAWDCGGRRSRRG